MNETLTAKEFRTFMHVIKGSNATVTKDGATTVVRLPLKDGRVNVARITKRADGNYDSETSVTVASARRRR